MSYFPRMIYKDGKLSARAGDNMVVNSIDELLTQCENGFYVLDCKNTEEVMEIDEISSVLLSRSKQKEDEAKIDAIVKKSMESIDKSEKVDPVVKHEPIVKRRAKRSK